MSRKDDYEMLTFSLLIIIYVFMTSTVALSRKYDSELLTFSLLIHHLCFHNIYRGYEQKGRF